MRLAQYLKSLISSGAYRATEIAERSGMFLSDLSKIVNGKRACGKAALERILGVMEPSHAAKLLKCWLEDQMPEGYSGKVYVVLGKGMEVASDKALAGTLEGDLAILRRVAETHPPVRNVLTT